MKRGDAAQQKALTVLSTKYILLKGVFAMLKTKVVSSISLILVLLVTGTASAFASDAQVWNEPGSWTALDDDGNPLVTVVAPDGTVFVPPTWGEAHANRSPVFVNGREFEFEAFRIGGYNYFKLRDLAYALNGTEKQFDVRFDSGTRTVSIMSGQPYRVIGGEMTRNTRATREPLPTNAAIMLDGNELNFVVYNIGGYNYFRLRDIAYALDFSVSWSDGRILVDTGKGYAGPAPSGNRLAQPNGQAHGIDLGQLHNIIFGGRATTANPIVISRSLESVVPADQWAVILQGVEHGLVVWAEDLE